VFLSLQAIIGTFSSQAHFQPALDHVVGGVNFSKEVYKKKKGGFIHKVHARCKHAGKSRVGPNDRKRHRDTLSVDLTSCCARSDS